MESESLNIKVQYADYVLLGDDGYPLAVVEAKKTSKDARIGQEQARQYAENIQKNSGKEIITNRQMPDLWQEQEEMWGFEVFLTR